MAHFSLMSDPVVATSQDLIAAPKRKKTHPKIPNTLFHTLFPITTCRGPTSAKKPILLTSVTMASRTSPLKGRKTIAWYCSGNVTKPIPSLIRPWICEWNRVG